MNRRATEKFAKIAESLRQYRRAELKDFEPELGSKPIEQLYVDPLPGDAVLQSVISSNTTFLLGRKGTGKSTIFAKAQSVLRSKKNVISIYIDVKSLYEVINENEISYAEINLNDISTTAYRSHILRKHMLGRVLSELLKEIGDSCNRMSILDRWKGVKKQYDELIDSLSDIKERVKNSKLEKHEIPILQKITNKIKARQQQESSSEAKITGKGEVKITPTKQEVSLKTSGSVSDFDKTLDDNDVYNEYSDVVLRSFPFNEIIDEIKILLKESKLSKLVVFFDDFSEIKFVDQRLFVDVILSPLNNSSNEAVKLKIAGYPGRVYYGKIDPGKIDTIGLDFSDLYESTETQEMERSAYDYTARLISKRFSSFGASIDDYFDFSSSSSSLPNQDQFFKLLFQSSSNVPRIIGHILHILYLDRVSKGQKITLSSIRLASKKYYENTIYRYFEKFNRYAMEPFENKLDRYNQNQLLNCIIDESKTVKKRITNNEIGGSYFNELGSNPQTSHFIVKPELESILSSLESNFFLSRYKKTRDKEGKDVIVYSLFYGLCESERIVWGYPDGRTFRNYFVQRCFDYTRPIHIFLSSNQTLKCNSCGFCHPMENKEAIEKFKWLCPECLEGRCSITNISDDFKEEVRKLNHEIMLDPIELEIITTLKEERKRMPAGEISTLIDTTHQMVGKRTSKLQEMGLVIKERDNNDGRMKSELTEQCAKIYFQNE